MSFELLQPQNAELTTTIINEAYKSDEAGIWIKDFSRTNLEEISSYIKKEEMFGWFKNKQLVSVIRIESINNEAHLGMVSIKKAYKGEGIPSMLFKHTHELLLDRGVQKVNLDLLMPKNWKHPNKEKLFSWYSRLGYEMQNETPFEEVFKEGLKFLATDCKFVQMTYNLKENNQSCYTWITPFVLNQVIGKKESFVKVQNYINSKASQIFFEKVINNFNPILTDAFNYQHFPYLSKIRTFKENGNILDSLVQSLELSLEQTVTINHNLTFPFVCSKPKVKSNDGIGLLITKDDPSSIILFHPDYINTVLNGSTHFFLTFLNNQSGQYTIGVPCAL